MNRLWNILTGGGEKKPCSAVPAEELSEFAGLLYTKYADRGYLVVKDGSAFLYNSEEPDPELRPLSAFPKDTGLTGFETEISFSPGVILPASFGENGLTIAEESLPASIRKAGEKLMAILFTGTEDVILFDTSRFLFYGFVDGKLILGNAEV